MRLLAFLTILISGCASGPFEMVHGNDPFTGAWALQSDWYDAPDGRRALAGAAEIRRGRLEYRAAITVHEVGARGRTFWARYECVSRLSSRRQNLEELSLRCNGYHGSAPYLSENLHETFALRRRSRDELVGEMTEGEDVPVRFRRVAIEFMQPVAPAS